MTSFERFDRLSSRKLLYLQTELLHLQAQLQSFDEEDYKEKTGETILSARCWETLAAKAEEHPREDERLGIILKIRSQMKEYQEALVLRDRVLKLQTPGARAFGAFAHWFDKSRPLVGHGKRLLEEHDNFVALGLIEEQDRLTKIIQDLGGKWLPGARHADSQEVKHYSGATINKVITGISIVLAALLLEGAIVALYLISNPHIQLVLIALFMVVFAAGIGLLSNARRPELFAATAAYAAVLVVFVSGHLGQA